jgi:catecholate siderophore receptor
VFAANGDDQLVIPFSDPLQIPAFGYSDLVRDRAPTCASRRSICRTRSPHRAAASSSSGLRYDRFDIDVLDLHRGERRRRCGRPLRPRRRGGHAPRLGFIYKPAENVSVYASYSETFLPISGDQFLTLNLTTRGHAPAVLREPRGRREVGSGRAQPSRRRLRAGARELHLRGPGTQEQVIVIEGSTTRGLELQLSGRTHGPLGVTTGYSYLDGEVKRADGSGNDGNRTRQTPENMFSLWSSYQLTSGCVWPSAPPTRTASSCRRTIPWRSRLHAHRRGGLLPGQRSPALQLNVENLLDEDYFPDAHSNDNISTGRPLNARLTVAMDL